MLAQPWVDVVLSGAATAAMVTSNLAALEVPVGAELLGRLAGLAEDPEALLGAALRSWPGTEAIADGLGIEATICPVTAKALPRTASV